MIQLVIEIHKISYNYNFKYYIVISKTMNEIKSIGIHGPMDHVFTCLMTDLCQGINIMEHFFERIAWILH